MISIISIYHIVLSYSYSKLYLINNYWLKYKRLKVLQLFQLFYQIHLINIDNIFAMFH